MQADERDRRADGKKRHRRTYEELEGLTWGKDCKTDILPDVLADRLP